MIVFIILLWVIVLKGIRRRNNSPILSKEMTTVDNNCKWYICNMYFFDALFRIHCSTNIQGRYAISPFLKFS